MHNGIIHQQPIGCVRFSEDKVNMDYQDGNGEGLFGARNENSVLFSLDSLTAMENEQSGAGEGSFGTSGDASGLIDLNTLSKLSAGASVEGVGENDVMASTVFNEVSTKEKKRNILLIIAIIAVLIVGSGAVVFFILHKTDEEKAAMAKENQEQIDAEQNKQAELEKRLLELEQQNAELNTDLKNRKADEKAVQEELERAREAAKAAGVAVNVADQGGDKPKRSGGSGGAAKGDAPAGEAAAPAPAPKAKTIDKGVLVAALKDATTKAAKCGKGGSLTVSFNIKNGSATNVSSAGGSFAGSATEKCILTVFQKYNWPDGNASGIKYPVKL